MGHGDVPDDGQSAEERLRPFLRLQLPGHAHSYFPTYLYRDDQRFDLPGNDGKGVGKIYAQNLIQEDVLKWVRGHKDQPFFLFYAGVGGFDNRIIDGMVNLLAYLAGFVGIMTRRIQTGKVQTYIAFALFGVLVFFLWFR